MAVTSITPVAVNKGTADAVAGNMRERWVDIVGPSSYTNSGTYATTGESLTQANLNALCGRPGAVITDIIGFITEPASGANNAGHEIMLDRVNGRLHYYLGAAEVAAAGPLNTFTNRVRVTHRLLPG